MGCPYDDQNLYHTISKKQPMRATVILVRELIWGAEVASEESGALL